MPAFLISFSNPVNTLFALDEPSEFLTTFSVLLELVIFLGSLSLVSQYIPKNKIPSITQEMM
ncbi:hypothetical protein Javan23_0005 [Streptococcus phage Javan23]|nr:hypothetical protein Javan23_0005 [Streptococcus phage Javan23]QBX25902.1 hypothetical protein Javan28_0005 [Streptococcus phage Javan28]